MTQLHNTPTQQKINIIQQIKIACINSKLEMLHEVKTIIDRE